MDDTPAMRQHQSPYLANVPYYDKLERRGLDLKRRKTMINEDFQWSFVDKETNLDLRIFVQWQNDNGLLHLDVKF
jgi:hypothetical protein